ncbi:MAG TPA: SMP-30/gluconolactonase/LRE family protein [Gemmatimonadaceae bacterium]|jgi:gluconolactonase
MSHARATFLHATIVLFTLAQTVGAQVFPTVGRIERLDPALDAIIPADAPIELLASGFLWSEGPVWRKSGGYLLFSDIPSNTINRWKDGEGISIFLRPAGYAGASPAGRELGSNGLTFDANDRLVMADHGNRQIARLNDSNFTKTTLADRYQGKRFNSPNDLVFHPNGDLYFTDPPYGLEGLNDSKAKELPFNGVYRLKPNGDVTRVIGDLTFPNGIAISPDARTLYVAVSDPTKPLWMAYDIQPDGSVARGRVFFDPAPFVAQRRIGSCDGLKVDRDGNLFATGPGGVFVFTPSGRHLGTIVTGEPTANVAFGDDGSTLYMTANNKLMRIRLRTKGLGF